jgi:hypothetical protein
MFFIIRTLECYTRTLFLIFQSRNRKGQAALKSSSPKEKREKSTALRPPARNVLEEN